MFFGIVKTLAGQLHLKSKGFIMAARVPRSTGPSKAAPYGYGKRKEKISKTRKATGKVYQQTQEVGRTQKPANPNDGARGRGVASAVALMGEENRYANDPLVLGGSGTEEDPYVIEDVYKALELLEGDHQISLRSRDEVATVISEMRKVVQDAASKGKDAPNYNLCRISVPGTNIFCADHKGIVRKKMPQLSGTPLPGTPASRLQSREGEEVDLTDPFMAHMEGMGIKIERTQRAASHLRATQSELIGEKVVGIAGAMQRGDIPRNRDALYVSRDGYVVDGHHRWAANVLLDIDNNDDLELPVYVVDKDILEILDIANQFTLDQGIPPRGMDDQ